MNIESRKMVGEERWLQKKDDWRKDGWKRKMAAAGGGWMAPP